MNYLCIGLSLFQLVSNLSSLSTLRFLRFLSELFVLIVEYFLITDASEWSDSCSHELIRAIQESHWHKCSVSTRRNLCLVLRRLQTCNKLHFHLGIVLSRPQFLNIIKVGYSFANTMRLQIK